VAESCWLLPDPFMRHEPALDVACPPLAETVPRGAGYLSRPIRLTAMEDEAAMVEL
jgi:hypothetical protein